MKQTHGAFGGFEGVGWGGVGVMGFERVIVMAAEEVDCYSCYWDL